MENAQKLLVLASTSPYRRQLLARLAYPFEIRAPDVEENALEGEAPAQTARRLAEAKARAVATQYSHALVLGSDQVADSDGIALSKPGDHATAVAQLRALSGRTVVFHTAVALVDAASGHCDARLVDVKSVFRCLSDDVIERYLARERPYDCAGAVRSEGLGIALFDAIESDDPTALVGLPLIAVAQMLRSHGIDVLLR
jgi:septum formation protein